MKPPKAEALKPTAEPLSITDQLEAILEARSKPPMIRHKHTESNNEEKDSRPVPDPTVLTTQQLETAVKALRELVEARLNAMDKAMALAEGDKTIFPNRIDEKISAVAGILEERFRSIGVQFAERDVREERTSRDGKLAIDAALQAAKEAVASQNTSSALAIAKSEAAAIKQIDQQASTIQAIKSALDEKVGDLKDRLLIFEGRGSGVQEAKSEGRDVGHYWIAILGAILSVAAVAITVALALAKNTP